MDETFPDLGSLTDVELKDVIRQLTEEETEISYKRRILHGKIDILRAELVNRLRKQARRRRHRDHRRGRPAAHRHPRPAASPRRGVSDRPCARLQPMARRPTAPRRRRRRRAMALHCTECGFLNSEGANYCQRCGALLGGAGEGAAASPAHGDLPDRRDRRARAGRDRRGHRARPGARDPRRRRARGRELPGRRRADEHRPPPRLRGVPRRRHRLARPRAADPPRRATGTSTTAARSTAPT